VTTEGLTTASMTVSPFDRSPKSGTGGVTGAAASVLPASGFLTQHAPTGRRIPIFYLASPPKARPLGTGACSRPPNSPYILLNTCGATSPPLTQFGRLDESHDQRGLQQPH